jgi:CHAD domain-containing protein
LQARATEREAARAVLAGSRFTGLLALCGANLAVPEARAPSVRRIRRAWSGSVGRLMRRAQKAARRPRHAGDERLHALRIEVRKLRYLLEMGAPASGDGALGKTVQAASRLQSALGALQDLVVARELVAAIAGKALAGTPAIAAALALEDAIARERRDALGKIAVAERRFRKLPIP